MPRLVAVALFALVLGGLAAFVVTGGLGPRSSGGVIATGKALVGGPFTLVDQTGKTVTDKDFLGKHMLVFFGFRNCPDICPAGLQTMAAALEAIGPKAERITPVFITLDAERDTPELLAPYVKSFHPRLVGLTGTAEQVQAAAKAYRVYFKKNAEGSADRAYSIDHTSIIYLMDPKGEFVAPFAHGASADAIAKRLNEVL